MMSQYGNTALQERIARRQKRARKRRMKKVILLVILLVAAVAAFFAIRGVSGWIESKKVTPMEFSFQTETTAVSYTHLDVYKRQDLFGMTGEEELNQIALPNAAEFSKKELLAMERETTGMYLSGHPLDDYAALLKSLHTVRVAELSAEDGGHHDGDTVLIAGSIASLRTKMTRSNALMAYVMLEDISGTLEVIVFPKTLERHASTLRQDALVTIRGRISERENGAPQIICDEVRSIENYGDRIEAAVSSEPIQIVDKLRVYLRIPSQNSPIYDTLCALLKAFSGKREAILYIEDTKKRMRIGIASDARLVVRLEELLGRCLLYTSTSIRRQCV